MLMAITREISAAIQQCELTHLSRTPIDLDRARAQHAAYEWALVDAGCTVRRLDTTDALPDSVFVEDVAVVCDEIAVMTRPGAETRRAETAAVANWLSNVRPLRSIEAPATMDGGDVLVVGKTVFIGLSARTDRAAAVQMRDLLAPLRYAVKTVPVSGCLHLKSAVTAVSPDTLLINRAWVPADAFAGLQLIDIDPAEPHAANAVALPDRVIYPASFPRTRDRLEAWGLDVRTVDMDELAKAEGAVTCCSLIFELWRP
jgi:dimethylargininase